MAARKFNPPTKQNRPFCFSGGNHAEPCNDSLTLFGPFGIRKYLNANISTPPRGGGFLRRPKRSGARLSEVLALTATTIELDNRVFELRIAQRDPQLATLGMNDVLRVNASL
jgi:hypothetical protein